MTQPETPTIRFAAPLYPQGRMCLLCGSVTVGAVFPPVGTPPNKWAWRVWVTADGFARDGSAKSEQAAKTAAMAAFSDFLTAAGLASQATAQETP